MCYGACKYEETQGPEAGECRAPVNPATGMREPPFDATCVQESVASYLEPDSPEDVEAWTALNESCDLVQSGAVKLADVPYQVISTSRGPVAVLMDVDEDGAPE